MLLPAASVVCSVLPSYIGDSTMPCLANVDMQRHSSTPWPVSVPNTVISIAAIVTIVVTTTILALVPILGLDPAVPTSPSQTHRYVAGHLNLVTSNPGRKPIYPNYS